MSAHETKPALHLTAATGRGMGRRGHGVPLKTVAALRPNCRLPAMVLMRIRVSFSQKSDVKVNIRYFELQ